jgi:hypothetical protein
LKIKNLIFLFINHLFCLSFQIKKIEDKIMASIDRVTLDDGYQCSIVEFDRVYGALEEVKGIRGSALSVLLTLCNHNVFKCDYLESKKVLKEKGLIGDDCSVTDDIKHIAEAAINDSTRVYTLFEKVLCLNS